ncbi:MAG: glycosyltransferase [Chloroflexi bacterium]|uniref:glycosyltransferase family 4 protein n=1 Tax=Candidatus Flexifilum breve TaxID=3140694 RepID=UPI00313486BA|nr:glycosyltransferase [Chloroflexota bacterium]
MRILLISRCTPYPLYLGDRLIVYHLARELAARGHKIDLLAFGDPEQDCTPFAEHFRDIHIIPESPRGVGSYLRRLANPVGRFPAVEAEAWSPDMWRAIKRAFDAHAYDLAHLFGGIHVYEFARAVEPLPMLITPYESYTLFLSRLAAKNGDVGTWLRLQVAREFERWMFTPYAKTVVVADRDRDELLRLNPKLPVEVISNGIDLSYFTPQTDQPRDPATLLFTGNFDYAPNVDAAIRLAIDILPRVRQVIPDAKVQLVGNKPPPEMCALNSDTVSVPGRVPDIRPYLAKASAFVSPLRLGAGIKNKVLEALAMACPVIASPLSLDGIDARDGHEVLVADSDAAVVDSIIRLLNNHALAAQLGAYGRKLIEDHYSWGIVADRYEALYQQIVR